jgi:hypothetical protein|tara:strand:- start:1069 stop:1530 length:462 start_codon:yes stop_codon:yes gene_type:complete
MISKIAEIDPTNSNLTKIIVLDQLQDKDSSILLNEFSCGKDVINTSVRMYRNIALILNLVKTDEGLNEWNAFIDRHMPKKEKISKLDNIFVSKNYDKLLLVTNRRLVSVDMKNLNDKIKKINTDIEILNDSVEKEIQPVEKKGFMDTIKGMFG